MRIVKWFQPPYGCREVDADQAVVVSADRVRCCIRGCSRELLKAHVGSRWNSECFCPEHHIRVSPSATCPTYVYKEATRNLIIDHDSFEKVEKVESWRIGNENSEDALTWNVFVGLERLGRLHAAVRALTGVVIDAEPRMYLWGNQIQAGDVSPSWPELEAVRDDLEGGFEIPTEPDVALHLPGKLLVLIEAKFGSRNSTLDRKKKQYETATAFLDRYVKPDRGPDPLDRAWIEAQPGGRILEQLCRLAVFGARMAKRGEKVVVVNLLRKKELDASRPDFASHLVTGGPVSFDVHTWEQLIPLSGGADNDTLHRYLTEKSHCLRPAFDAASSGTGN